MLVIVKKFHFSIREKADTDFNLALVLVGKIATNVLSMEPNDVHRGNPGGLLRRQTLARSNQGDILLMTPSPQTCVRGRFQKAVSQNFLAYRV